MAKQSRRARAKLECQRAIASLDSFVLHVEWMRTNGYPEIDSTWAQSFAVAQEGTVGLAGIVDWWLSHL